MDTSSPTDTEVDPLAVEVLQESQLPDEEPVPRPSEPVSVSSAQEATPSDVDNNVHHENHNSNHRQYHDHNQSDSYSQSSYPPQSHYSSSTQSFTSNNNNNSNVPSNDGDRELFVGDLSYFCQESDLLTLFRQYGHVVNVRIRRSEKKGHSLMHGFVRMSKPQDAKRAMHEVNGMLYMGRFIRVQPCNGSLNQFSEKGGFQIHVSFFTQMKTDTLITEESLRALFVPYGDVVDTIICRHILQRNPPKQAGYGFVYLADEGSKEIALENLSHIMLDGIQFDCSVSHRTTPNNKPMNMQSHSNDYESDNGYSRRGSGSDHSGSRDQLRGTLMRDNSTASHNSDVHPLSRASSINSVGNNSNPGINKPFHSDEKALFTSPQAVVNHRPVPQLLPPSNVASHQLAGPHVVHSSHIAQQENVTLPSGLPVGHANAPPQQHQYQHQHSLHLQIPPTNIQSMPVPSPHQPGENKSNQPTPFGYYPAQYPMMYNYPPMSPMPMSPGFNPAMGMMFPVTPPSHGNPYMYPMQVMNNMPTSMDPYYGINQQAMPVQRQSSNHYYQANPHYSQQYEHARNSSYNHAESASFQDNGRNPQQAPQQDYSQHMPNSNMGQMQHDQRRRHQY